MKKNNILRNIIIAATVLFFLGVAVFVIIISQGGLITREGIVETGVIRLDVVPGNIDYKVYIDGKETKVVDDRINNLAEKEYTIEIEADQYAPWTKQVFVYTGVVTDVDARLFPVDFEITQVTNTSIDKAFFSRNGEFIYYVVVDNEISNENGIWRLRLTNNNLLFGGENKPEKISNITDLYKEAFNQNKYSIQINEANSKIIVSDLINNEHYILAADEQNLVPEIELNTALDFNPERVFWLSNEALLIEKSNSIYEYNLDNDEVALIDLSEEGKLIYTIANDKVFYLNSSEQIYEYSNNETSQLEIDLKSFESISALYSGEASDEYLMIQDNSGYSILDIENNKSYPITDNSHIIETVANSGKSALFIKNNSMVTFTVEEIIAEERLTPRVTNTDYQASVASSARYGSNSKSIILHDQQNQRLIITDVNGENELTIVSEYQSFENQSYFFNANSNSFFVLLGDLEQNTVNLYTASL